MAEKLNQGYGSHNLLVHLYNICFILLIVVDVLNCLRVVFLVTQVVI